MIRLSWQSSERRFYVDIVSDFEEKSVSISVNQSDNISIDEHRLSLLVNSEILPSVLFSVKQIAGNSVKPNLKLTYRSESGELLKGFLENNECDLSDIVLQLFDFLFDNDEEDISYCLTEISNMFIENNRICVIEMPFKVKHEAFGRIDVFSEFIDEVASISSDYEQKLRFLREELAEDSFTKDEVISLLNKQEAICFDDADNADSPDRSSADENSYEYSEAQEKVCPSCGAVCDDRYVFCINCGANLKSIAKEKTGNSASSHAEKSYEAEEKKTNETTQSFEEVMNSDEASTTSKHSIHKNGIHRVHLGKVKTVAARVYASEKNEADKEEGTEKEEKEISGNTAVADTSGAQGNDLSDKEKSDTSDSGNGEANGVYAETTLLGFTNFGETTVLDSSAVFGNTPNIVRLSTGEKIYITKRNFLVGKSRSKVDYTIENNEVISRIHCEISTVGNDYYVIDRGSTNGTYLNGCRIQSQVAEKISDGDEIKLANEIFKFNVQ